jgi:F0F1-type ATP synthase assembly protein I
MEKQRPEDFEKLPEEFTEDERAEFLEKLDELERDAAAKLEAAPIDAAQTPMAMPEVLKERPSSAHAAGRQFKGADQSALARVWAIGLNFGLMVLAGGLLGWGADSLFNSKPWGVLVGLLLGLVVGFAQFIREALAANRRPPPRSPR